MSRRITVSPPLNFHGRRSRISLLAGKDKLRNMTDELIGDWERVEKPLLRLSALCQSENISEEIRQSLGEAWNELELIRSRWEELQRAALEDALTGAGNRRGFELQIRRAFSAAVRYQTPLSIIIVDVDRFKVINDRYGHVAGDQVLRRVARIMREGLRGADYLARYGGDEFVAILPSTPLAGAEQVVVRLQYELCQPLLWCDHSSGVETAVDVSVGIGCAALQDSDQNEWNLFQRADESLMRVKQGVKNG